MCECCMGVVVVWRQGMDERRWKVRQIQIQGQVDLGVFVSDCRISRDVGFVGRLGSISSLGRDMSQ
jgi:hypothetical protein